MGYVSRQAVAAISLREAFRSVERKCSITAVWLDATIKLARRKALVFIVFPLVTKISVRNGYQLYVGKIGYQNLILESAVSTSSQVANLLLHNATMT